MSFLLPLALALGLTAVLPLIAHALRRGQARPLPFPATRLVPSKTSSAKERHRVEDKLLLLLRALLLFTLAMLAASPFVQCSRLSLSRTHGGSLSAAIVIDDSASMRARTDSGTTRLQSAVTSARQLLQSAQPGDSFSLVLAGKPARILSPPTTEIASIKDALESIAPSDRETDLKTALTLARELQSEVVHEDRPIVVLSDMAITDTSSLDLKGVMLPDSDLNQRAENCALATATRGSDAVQVEIACTSAASLKGRSVQLLDQKGQAQAKPVPAQDGMVRIELPRSKDGTPKKLATQELVARMTAPANEELDRIDEDNEVAVLDVTSALTIAVRADQAKAGMKTGAGTVIQAGLEALERDLRVEPLSLLPDQAAPLQPMGALFIDDPSGFTPEVRDTLSEWVKSGGVAVVFLGPGIGRAPLGSDFAPFLQTAPTWARHESPGADPDQAGQLGPLSVTWTDLGARWRANVGEEEGMVSKVKWADGAPLIAERLHGRGLLLVATLPASVDVSDFALRPAYLELLDYVVSQAAIRRGAQATPVGRRWMVGSETSVTDPTGERLVLAQGETEGRLIVEPNVAGRYTFHEPAGPSLRVAMRHPAEHVRQPTEVSATSGVAHQEATLSEVAISREIALLALILSALELVFRALRRRRPPASLPSAA